MTTTQARRWIWVVEMMHDKKGTWQTTVGVGLCRDDARRELAKWKNGCDRFRLRKYYASVKP